ncbi:hypothetical protein EnteroDNA1_00720 [Enterobacter sp. HK169]|nr:hypothetical protein EnteroDNA1_00720 [Enterobacter sp. HK169]
MNDPLLMADAGQRSLVRCCSTVLPILCVGWGVLCWVCHSISFVGAVIINRSQQKTIPYPLVIYILRGVFQ